MTNPSIVGVAPGGGAFHGDEAASPILNRFWSSRVLNNCVLVWKYSSPESGLGESMSVATVYGTTCAVSAVLGPLGNRVAQALADDPVEGLAVLGTVEVSEDVVERSVLEEHKHDVVEGVRLIRSRASAMPPYLTDRDCGRFLATAAVISLVVHQRPRSGIMPLSGS